MRSFFWVGPACWVLGVACGGDSESNGSRDPADAADATGGAGQGAGGSGTSAGGASAGGVPAAGGLPAGTGGVPAESGPCAPAGPGQTALCITLVPEDIAAETERALDKRGVLAVQVFNTPNPPDVGADRIALAGTLLPATAAAGDEIPLDSVGEVRLEGPFPATIYVRALFLDNATEIEDGIDIGYGSWIGGTDLSRGFGENLPLSAVQITPGQGNAIQLSLTALRKLEVTVRRTAAPVGDGEGPLSVIVVDRENPSPDAGFFGIAAARCVDLSTGSVTVTGAVLGSGPYFVTGILNDLLLPGPFPPGALAAFVVGDSGVARIPARLTIAPRDYSVSATIDLRTASPLPADAGALSPNSCEDLFPPLPEGGADAGMDAGADAPVGPGADGSPGVADAGADSSADGG